MAAVAALLAVYGDAARYAALEAGLLGFYAAQGGLGAYRLDGGLAQARVLLSPCEGVPAFTECARRLETAPAALGPGRGVVSARHLLLLSFTLTIYSLQCSDEFMILDQCGFALELHPPRSERVLLLARRFELVRPGAPQTAFLDLSAFCAGEYELWAVNKQREQRWVVAVKPLYLQNDAC